MVKFNPSESVTFSWDLGASSPREASLGSQKHGPFPPFLPWCLPVTAESGGKRAGIGA